MTYTLQKGNKIKNSKNSKWKLLLSRYIKLFFSDKAFESTEKRAQSIRYEVAVNERNEFKTHSTEREW